MTKTQKRLASIVTNFRRLSIAVLGDYMLDELLRGEATRISPEAPVPVVLIRDESTREGSPGGAGNVAANIAALGGRAVPFGVIGHDRGGQRLSELLQTCKIPCVTLCREPGRTTPRKVRVVAHQQQLLRLDFEQTNEVSPASAHKLTEQFARRARRLAGLIISDYRKGTVTTEIAGAFMTLARQHRVPVFVDPKPDHPEVCRGATIITPNLREAEIMSGVSLRNRRDLEKGGARLRRDVGCQYLLITRGSEGMTLFGPGGEFHHIPGVSRPVYDVTGAGDTVIATLALAYAAGAKMIEAATLANFAAGRVVLKFGTATVTPQELFEAVAAQFT